MSPDFQANPSPSVSSNRRNQIVFVLLCVAVIAGVVAFALYARSQRRQRENSAAPTIPESTQQAADVRQHPYLMFRNTALGPTYGQLSFAPLDAPDGVRYAAGLTCDRVYGTSNSGLCLQSVLSAFPVFKAVSFDSRFQVVHVFNLAGEPSRARVSPDGQLGSSTVFITGHSYGGVSFSTRTAIYDLASGTMLIDDLENCTVTKNGQPFKNADFNFWGVTFAKDDDRFYATLGSAGVYYLVEGFISRRQMRVMREGVECPSLSPDGGRLVFKSRTSSERGIIWHLHVLDLKTWTETAVNEPRSVDDQAEWLDADHVLYGLPRNIQGSATWDIWAARVDGTGTPTLLVHDALSPCVVRPGTEATTESIPSSAISATMISHSSNILAVATNEAAASQLSFVQSYRLPRDGTPIFVDLVTGAVTTERTGVLMLQSWTENFGKKSGQRFNWRCRLTLPGGGFATADEEFSPLAPAGGYAPSIGITMSADQSDWKNNGTLKLYCHLADGRYGKISFSMFAGPLNYCLIDSYVNPSGSRNLKPQENGASKPQSSQGTTPIIPSFK